MELKETEKDMEKCRLKKRHESWFEQVDVLFQSKWTFGVIEADTRLR